MNRTTSYDQEIMRMARCGTFEGYLSAMKRIPEEQEENLNIRDHTVQLVIKALNRVSKNPQNEIQLRYPQIKAGKLLGLTEYSVNKFCRKNGIKKINGEWKQVTDN